MRRHSKHITRGPRWKALRLLALRRDGFACVQCGARGPLEVDHIRSVREAPELAHDLDNLQCLCARCHSAKTSAEITGKPPDPQRRAWRRFARELETTEQKPSHRRR